MFYINTAHSMAQVIAGGNTGNGSPEPARIYTIYNISMDQTASTASKARAIALKQAQRIALKRLFHKILRKQDYDKLPNLTDDQVSDLANGLEIAHEKSSYVRYLADLTVHFSRDKINNFLSARKIPFAETLSLPVNILAVLQQDGAALLWQKDNAWRAAWKNYDTMNNLVPIRVIEPSLANRMALTFWQAWQDDKTVLQKFADERAIRKLYVITARVEKYPAVGRRTLELTIHGSGDDKNIFSTTIDIGKAGDVAILYDAAIRRATYWLDNRWKEKVLVHYGLSSHLKVKIHFDRRQDWFIIRKKLASISLIRNITYLQLTFDMIEVNLEYSGDIEQIMLALGQKKLIMTKPSEGMVGTSDITPSDISATPEDYIPLLTLKK